MKKFLIAAIALCLLAACGKRGNLDYPSGAFYPRAYPEPRMPKRPATAGKPPVPEIEETPVMQNDTSPFYKEEE